jgi:signal transduction histidine kinase
LIQVSDAGPGVPVEERAIIFDAFYQSASTQASATGALRGTGIGLSVVRECVQAHGGHIDVDDAPGGGARFTVEIPDRHAL